MHEVEALIAETDHLAAAARKFETATVCSLAQGFSLLPITDALAKELRGYQPETKDIPTKPLGYCRTGYMRSRSQSRMTLASPISARFILAGRADKMRSSGTKAAYVSRRSRRVIRKAGPIRLSVKP